MDRICSVCDRICSILDRIWSMLAHFREDNLVYDREGVVFIRRAVAMAVAPGCCVVAVTWKFGLKSSFVRQNTSFWNTEFIDFNGNGYRSRVGPHADRWVAAPGTPFPSDPQRLIYSQKRPIKNDEICIKDDEFCIKNDDLTIQLGKVVCATHVRAVVDTVRPLLMIQNSIIWNTKIIIIKQNPSNVTQKPAF